MKITQKERSRKYYVENTEKMKINATTWNREHSEKRQSSHQQRICREMGLPLNWYSLQEEKQMSLCAICGKPETINRTKTKNQPKLVIDHSHKTGKVRELLCHKCNVALGLFDDELTILKNAIEYLNKHSEVCD
jgi:hypothetical protein